MEKQESWFKNMEKVKKNQKIAFTRNAVGWVYPELLWFSEEEANLANQQRNELLEALSGWVTYSFQGSKLHSGALSPGCLICGGGGWGWGDGRVCGWLQGDTPGE